MEKSIIITIIDLLKVDDFYGVSETIDIAKGKNELPLTFKQMNKSIKRNKKYHGN